LFHGRILRRWQTERPRRPLPLLVDSSLRLAQGATAARGPLGDGVGRLPALRRPGSPRLPGEARAAADAVKEAHPMKALKHLLELLGRFVRDWNDFWFKPADPTTLGLIRILAGFLVLYAHIAYSGDLYEFFGKDAWLSLNGANLQRRQTPRTTPPTGW